MAWSNLLLISWAVLFYSSSAEVDRNNDLPPFYRSYFPSKPESGNLPQSGKIDSIHTHAIGAEKHQSAIANNADPQINTTQTAFSMMPIPKKLALSHRSRSFKKNGGMLPELGIKSSFPKLDNDKSPSAYHETLDKHYLNDKPKDLQSTYSSFQKRYNELLRQDMEQQLAKHFASEDRFLDPIWSQFNTPSYIPERSDVVEKRDEAYFNMPGHYPLYGTHSQSYYDALNRNLLVNDQGSSYLGKDDTSDADQEEDTY